VATFRTDPNTGRAVISEENRVDRSGLSGRRGSTVQDRYSGGPDGSDGPSGGFGPPVGFDFGTGTAAGTLTQQEFMNVTGRTDTNPYGKQGFFSRVFGIDPSKIDYTNNFGQNAGESRGIMATLNNRAYNAYLNPVDLSSGFVNPMLDEGSLTRFGRVERDPNLRQGIAGFGLPSMIANLFDRSDLVVPGQPASDARRQDIGILDFETPKNMDELVSSALREQAPRNVDGLSDLETFEPFTTDPDVRNPESYFADINTRPQETPVTPGSTRPDDATMPSVAEVLAAAPMVTSEYEEMVGATPEESGTYIVGNQIAPTSTSRMVYTIEGTTPAEQAYLREIRDDDLMYDYDRSIPTGSTVLQNIPGGDPGSASITVRPGSETPTYGSGDGQVDLITPFLPGMEDILNVPPRPQVDPRTGRIPGTSGTFNL